MMSPSMRNSHLVKKAKKELEEAKAEKERLLAALARVEVAIETLEKVLSE